MGTESFNRISRSVENELSRTAGYAHTTFLGYPLCRWVLDVPGKSHEFEGANDPASQVDLPPFQPMHCRTWKGMMIVVPGIPKRHEGQPEIVLALIVGLKGLAAIDVTDRVNPPCDVVPQVDADKPAPQESVEDPQPRPCQEPARESREGKPHKHPNEIQPIDLQKHTILKKVGGIAAYGRSFRAEQPPSMGMP